MPMLRAAAAGNSDRTSSVAVNIKDTRSSCPMPFRPRIVRIRAAVRSITCSRVSASKVVAPRSALNWRPIGEGMIVAEEGASPLFRPCLRAARLQSCCCEQLPDLFGREPPGLPRGQRAEADWTERDADEVDDREP